MTVESQDTTYPARLKVDYVEQHDRMTTFFRLLLLIPIAVVIGLLSSQTSRTGYNPSGQSVTTTTGSIAGGLFAATVLMIVFRQRYPRWWFDFALQLTRFSTRVGAYAGLLTDQYPSTVDEQSVHLELDYPDAEHDLNRWLPLVKWFLVIPHVIVLAFLYLGAVVAVFFAWIAIIVSGTYPRALFDYVVGVARWALRVQAYATLLVTDRYPPFSLA